MREVQGYGMTHHVLVCTNQRRTVGMPCCADAGGEEIWRRVREYIQRHDLTYKVWVSTSGCLGFCTHAGGTLVIYPPGAWLSEVTPDEVEGLLDAPLKSH